MGRWSGPKQRGYLAAVRRRVVGLLASDRKGADVARDLGIGEQAV